MKAHLFESREGRRLSWYELGQGRPLVLLHGWSMSAAVFAELATLLGNEYRLLIPDLPGHGNSAPLTVHDLASMSLVLTEWLEAVEQRPFSLAGWSLGGMLALEMADAGRLPIERLALMGTTPRFVNGDDWSCGLPATQVRALSRNLQRRFTATLGEFFTLAFDGEEIAAERLRAIRTFAVRQSPLPEESAANELLGMLLTQDQRSLLSNIEQPALVLHGALDKISPVAAGRYLAETLRQGRCEEFSGVGHAPFLSRPHDVAAAIRAFC